MKEPLLINEWSTQQQDMEIAGEIIDKYRLDSEGEPLGLIEIVIDKTKPASIQIRVSEWVTEIVTHFRNQYGYQQGQMVAAKVITRFLLKNETIH